MALVRVATCVGRCCVAIRAFNDYANGQATIYQIVTPALRNTVQRVEIYKAERFSDHAPLIMDYVF